MIHRFTAPVAASALLIAALTLTACSGSSKPAAKDAALSTGSASSAAATPTAVEAASTGGGCPAELLSTLNSTDSSKYSEATSADLKFPGTLSGLDEGCFISADVSSTKEVLGFVPGGKDLTEQATAALKKAGYSETGGVYSKGGDVWLVSGVEDSSSPLASLGSALDSTFGADTVMLMHAAA